MSLRKKKPTTATKKTLSDKIAELLLPQPLLDPEFDATDETVARTRNFAAAADVDGDGDADDQLGEIDPRFSEIRKRNVTLLQDVDAKYSGQVASRKDLDAEEENDEDDDEHDDEETDESGALESSDDELPRKKFDESDDEEEEEDEDDEDDDDDEQVEQDSDDDGEPNAEHASVGSEDESDETDDSDDFDDATIDLAPRTSAIAAAAAATPTPATDDATVHVRPANLSAELQKGHSVQNQLHIWEKLLQMRIHSQQILINANTLPSHRNLPVLRAQSADCATAADRLSASASTMLEKLLELQTVLVAQFPETAALATGGKAKRKPDAAADDADGDALAKRIRRHGAAIGAQHSAYTGYRNAVLLKWHDRTKVLAAGSREGRHQQQQQRDAAAAHNILQSIDGALLNREELRRRTQCNQRGYRIMGMPAPQSAADVQPDPMLSAQQNAERAAAVQQRSVEIYDDTDFYQTQLRELIEFKAANSATNPDEMNRQFAELQRLRKKMKKVVDTRASKGRKIRYVVHNKLVNFAARQDAGEWTDEGKTQLYASLFGKGNAIGE